MNGGLSSATSSSSLPRFPSLNADDKSGTTHITLRTERTIRTKLLQNSIRRATSTTPKHPPPPGTSPELRAPESVFEFCNVRQRRVDGVRIYDINPRSVSTRENFIPAQIADLKTELEPIRSTTSAHSGYPLYQVQTHENENITSQDFAKSGTKQKRKQIYYFAGGGFHAPAGPEHWKFCAHLCHILNDEMDVPTTISIVSYPLAPGTTARQSITQLELMYRSILPQTPPGTPVHSSPKVSASPKVSPSPGAPVTPQQSHSPLPHAFSLAMENMSKLSLKRTTTTYLAPEEDIIFMGDSAGANIALSLTMKILATDPRARPPAAVFVISPPVDLRHDNPDMKKLDKSDPILSLDYVNDTATKWLGNDVDATNPLVSPLLGDVGVFARRRVFVHGVVAGNDVLAPDAKIFIEKCKTMGVKGEWLVWEKQMHCFPLSFSYKLLPEANQAVDWIIEVLSKTAPANG